MREFYQRQLVTLLLMIGALLVAFAASDFIGAAILPVWVGRPFYLNPVIDFALIFFGLMGLFTVFRTNDQGWVFLMGAVGIWILAIAIEDSILQWFVFQLGAQTIGGRVNAIQIAAVAAAVAFAIQLHVNQLGQRLREGFAERGLDPRELRGVEDQARAVGRTITWQLVGLVSAAGAILWVAEFALGRADLGLNVLGILGGLIIVVVIALAAYRVLRQGPVAPVGQGAGATRQGGQMRAATGRPAERAPLGSKQEAEAPRRESR